MSSLGVLLEDLSLPQRDQDCPTYTYWRPVGGELHPIVALGKDGGQMQIMSYCRSDCPTYKSNKTHHLTRTRSTYSKLLLSVMACSDADMQMTESESEDNWSPSDTSDDEHTLSKPKPIKSGHSKPLPFARRAATIDPMQLIGREVEQTFPKFGPSLWRGKVRSFSVRCLSPCQCLSV